MKKSEKEVKPWIYWTPRILSVIFILFLGLMSLDVFSPELTFWQTILALFMHNVPALILLIAVLFAWKYELVGAIAFILGGLLYIVLILISAIRDGFHGYMISWAIQISGMAFFIGILYYLNWKQKKK